MDENSISRRTLFGGAAGTIALSMPVTKIASNRSPRINRAMEVWRWLQSRKEGDRWLSGSDDGKTLSSLYQGGAGVLYFLSELHRVSPTKELREEIHTCARQLAKDAIAEGTADCGLYSGLAGMTVVLERCASAIQSEELGTTWRALRKTLLAAAKPTGNGVAWDDSLDVISGGAGIILALLHLHRSDPDSESISVANRAGLRLIQAGTPADKGTKWFYKVGTKRELPNFSHGTAGVAFSLASLHRETGDHRMLDAALSGAEYLLSVARTEDDGCEIFYDNHVVPPIYYMGWCHGPTGTARLFLQLERVTGDRRWSDWALRGANTVVNSGIPDHHVDGFWNNLGVCCGNAGVALFFSDLYLKTGDKQYLDYALRHESRIDKEVVALGNGNKRCLHWTWAENRVEPNKLSEQTGLMQGAAGIGILYLTLQAAVDRTPAPSRLPDAFGYFP